MGEGLRVPVSRRCSSVRKRTRSIGGEAPVACSAIAPPPKAPTARVHRTSGAAPVQLLRPPFPPLNRRRVAFIAAGAVLIHKAGVSALEPAAVRSRPPVLQGAHPSSPAARPIWISPARGAPDRAQPKSPSHPRPGIRPWRRRRLPLPPSRSGSGKGCSLRHPATLSLERALPQYRSLKAITVVSFIRNFGRRIPWREPRSRQKVLA